MAWLKNLFIRLLKWGTRHANILIPLGIIIASTVLIGIRDSRIKKLAANVAKLENANTLLSQQRANLEKQLGILMADYNKLEKTNDSLKALLQSRQRELREMIVKHKAEIDSLMKIPNDSVYVRLQPIYPNFDGAPLIYPFSGSQIRQVYNTALQFPMLQEEYILQGRAMKTCTDLNIGYERAIGNLENQVYTLQDNVKMCDQQVGNYKAEVSILNRQAGRKTFWNRFWIITSLAATTIVIIK